MYEVFGLLCLMITFSVKGWRGLCASFLGDKSSRCNFVFTLGRFVKERSVFLLLLSIYYDLSFPFSSSLASNLPKERDDIVKRSSYHLLESKLKIELNLLNRPQQHFFC